MDDPVAHYTSFTQVYTTWKDKIYSYVYFRVGRDRDVVEDLVSDIFLKAYEKYDGTREVVVVRSWLYTIARNRIIDHYRTRKETIPVEDIELSETPDALFTLIDDELDLERVTHALQELTPLQRTLVTARYLEDQTFDEIARREQMEQPAVRKNVSRGIAKLRELLAALTLITLGL